MLRFLFNLSIFVVGLSSLFAFMSVQAQETTTTVIEKHVVVTPVPKSVTCTTIKAHWEGNIWVNDQTICKYPDRTEGVAWVSDYWACAAATADGTCTNWELKPGYWVKTYP